MVQGMEGCTTEHGDWLLLGLKHRELSGVPTLERVGDKGLDKAHDPGLCWLLRQVFPASSSKNRAMRVTFDTGLKALSPEEEETC